MECSRCKAPNPPIHVYAKAGNVIIDLNLCQKCAISDIVIVLPPKANGMIRCPRCGMSVADLQATGRMGCADDYEIFASSLMKGITEYHGASQHVGKSPSKKIYSA